eukprot:SAG11_NODE_906_length_6600_cov_8.505461_3_plen_401_part_00
MTDHLVIRRVGHSTSAQSAAAQSHGRRGVQQEQQHRGDVPAGRDRRSAAPAPRQGVDARRIPRQQTHHVPGLATTYGGPELPSPNVAAAPPTLSAAASGGGGGAYGIGNRNLPNEKARGPIGGEVEAGYGIGNRNLSRNSRRGGSRGGESSAAASAHVFGKPTGEDVGDGGWHGRKRQQWNDGGGPLIGDGSAMDFPPPKPRSRRSQQRHVEAAAAASASAGGEMDGIWMNAAEPVRESNGRRRAVEPAGGSSAGKCLQMMPNSYDASWRGGGSRERRTRVDPAIVAEAAARRAAEPAYDGWHNPSAESRVHQGSKPQFMDAQKGLGGILGGQWEGDASRGCIATTGHSINPGSHMGATKGTGMRVPLAQRQQVADSYNESSDAACANRRRMKGGARIMF